MSTSHFFTRREISKQQVTSQITSVQAKLKTYKDIGAQEYASDEIKLIEEYIKSAENYLSKEKNSRAFYEVSIGKAYFIMIDSKKQLKDSKEKFEKLKSSLNQ